MITNNGTICKRCVMDISASNIKFDQNGYCNFCTDSLFHMKSIRIDDKRRQERLGVLVDSIKKAGKGKDYDCIVGVSGGLDSSYVLLKTKELNLRPLAVHLDNNWNSELSNNNIESLVKYLNIDLYTHVIDWEEFRKLQIAFIKSNVVDIEIITDHALLALLYKVAKENEIKYLLAGTNIANEGMTMPREWNHFKVDLPNIKDVYRRFSDGKPLKTFPMMSLKKYMIYKYIYKIKWTSLLNYYDYRKENAMIELQKIGWKPYEKKHYESVFTRFYQGYILPRKFNVDKRKVHYSTLICSGQMTREEALLELKNDSYRDQNIMNQDKTFVLKKLGISTQEFEDYINAPGIPHSHYSSNEKYYNLLKKIQASL